MRRRNRWHTWIREGPHLYVITDPGYAGKSHIDIVREAIAGGAELIQMRDKHLPDRLFYEQAKACARLCREKGVWFFVNDRVHIALAVGADGVHIGQDDLPPHVVRQLIGDDMLIGRSTHDPEQFRRAQTKEPVDYVAFGPIYPTQTKPDYTPIGVRLFSDMVPLAEKPVVAIGGIQLDRLPAVLQTGVHLVAVVSDIMRGPIPDRVAAYRQAIQQFRTGASP